MTQPANVMVWNLELVGRWLLYAWCLHFAFPWVSIALGWLGRLLKHLKQRLLAGESSENNNALSRRLDERQEHCNSLEATNWKWIDLKCTCLMLRMERPKRDDVSTCFHMLLHVSTCFYMFLCLAIARYEHKLRFPKVGVPPNHPF